MRNEKGFVEEIHQWRRHVLSDLADRISGSEHANIQSEIGVWNKGGDISYPDRSAIRIINDEVMSFEFMVGASPVMFSVWMMTGEIRIGVKVPTKISPTENIRSKISSAYDGLPCTRMYQDGSDLFFDWIWKDREFASFDFMTQAMFSEKHAAIIVDRMTQVCIHLYISIITALMDSNKLYASQGQIDRVSYNAYLISVQGDASTLEWYLSERLKAKIIRSDKGTANSPTICKVAIPASASLAALAPGEVIFDQDGGRCRIVALKRLSEEERQIER